MAVACPTLWGHVVRQSKDHLPASGLSLGSAFLWKGCSMSGHRLLTGCRLPARLVMGIGVASLELAWDGRSALAPLSGVLLLEAHLSHPRTCLQERHPSRETWSTKATQRPRGVLYSAQPSPYTAPDRASDRHAGA